jgi:hypothetical protein
MKFILFILMPLSIIANLSAADETLDQMLSQRIKLNEKYRDQFTKEAAESRLAKDLQPLEKQIGQHWVDYLTYVKAQKDDKLKAYVIRLELLDELRGCYYDLEYTESVVEKAALKLEIAKWKKELEILKGIVEKSK